jgi:two-component sensor histidine kinase
MKNLNQKNCGSVCSRADFFASLAVRYLQFPLGEIDYRQVGHDLVSLSGAHSVFLNLYVADKHCIETKAFASSLTGGAVPSYGPSFVGRSWPMDDAVGKTFRSSELTPINAETGGGLDTMVHSLFSRFGEVGLWALCLLHDGRFLGNFFMVFEKGEQKPDRRGIDAFTEIVVRLLLRKEKERQLQQNLTEKDLILRESHHRIKNNLSLISSLVALQGELLSPELASLLYPIISRINAIVLIHEQLHEAGSDGKQVRFETYVRRLVGELADSFRSDDSGITLSILRADHAFFEDGTAIPLGIILTELVMNSFKHAFKGLPGGRIDVSFMCEDQTAQLIVQDDGRGMVSSDIPKQNSAGASLGLVLVESLTAQLQGHWEQSIGEKGRGLKNTVVFPLP